MSPFYELLGRFSQSLTRWPTLINDRHGHRRSRASSYTTPRDSIRTVAMDFWASLDAQMERLHKQTHPIAAPAAADAQAIRG